ncbi:MAG: bifunctional adenosylcobinamide kinase/adenosylcobinamide-phosphate guanylyltransferase [Rhodospirillales bacterium]|nr:bifunctional adenosylcobinamide kinase/adenosylcobinamide-phosphate guanylyltransferase [Rhodospirillales bacterium]
MVTKSETLPPVTLVLGGARSGKSAYAENLIETSGLNPVYLATAEAGDDEMAERIRRHKARRGDRWRTVEEALSILPALQRHAAPGSAVLVDCLTIWLANLMADSRDIEAETDLLVAGLDALAGPVVFVSNEVGLGIVPANGQAREFRDHAGRLNQAVAAVADRAVMLVAGLPLELKPAA